MSPQNTFTTAEPVAAPPPSKKRGPSTAHLKPVASPPPKMMLRSHTKKVLHMTVKEALAKLGPNAEQAIDAEIEQMIKKQVWSPVLIGNEKKHIIPSSMFLTEKKDGKGKLIKYQSPPRSRRS
jgi:hypothetical protein